MGVAAEVSCLTGTIQLIKHHPPDFLREESCPLQKQKRKLSSRCASSGLPYLSRWHFIFGQARRCRGFVVNFHNAGKTFVVLAFLDLLLFFLPIRWKTYSPAFALVQEQPENVNAIRGWGGHTWIIFLCLAESEALFGLAFRMGDKTLAQSLPFYALGILLTLWLWPREFWPSAPSA